jgi:hypothetical protein
MPRPRKSKLKTFSKDEPGAETFNYKDFAARIEGTVNSSGEVYFGQEFDGMEIIGYVKRRKSDDPRT